MTRSSCLKSLGLLAVLAGLQGCFIMPLEPKSKGAATDQYKVEMEFLTNVTLVSEDTSPWWDLGRHAYRTGTDRMIIVGRTTAYADKDEDYEPIPGTMRDRKMERVWITIPSDVPLGKALKLETLEEEKITGYDVNNLDSKGFFKGPHLMKGFVNLVEETPDHVVVIFDIEIRPNRPFQAENWKIEGKHTIPVVPQGKIATAAVSRDVQVNATPNGNGNNANGTGETPATPVNTTPGTNPAAPLTAPLTNNDKPENGNTTATKPEEVKPVENKSIVGKWVAEHGGFEFRFQFNEDGKFIYSHTRGDGISDSFAPGMNAGTYQLKKTKTAEWVVMVVERCEFDGVDASKDLYADNKTVMLKTEWDGDKLILTGAIPVLKNKTTKLEATAMDFEDMNKVLPPRGRKKNAPGEPNPKPYW